MSAVLENQEPRTKNPALGSWLSATAAWFVGVLLFAAALWIRLRMLDFQPLWLDEGRTWAIVTQSRIGTLLLGLLSPTEAYPLYHVLLKPVLRLLGDGEYALRLPSAVAGALSVPALLALGRELRGWVLGLSSSLLLLLAPWAIGQAQDAKAYSLVLLTVILLALAFARALRSRPVRQRGTRFRLVRQRGTRFQPVRQRGTRFGTRRAWLAFAAVALIAPFVHRLLVFSLLACAVAWAVWRQTRQTRQTNKPTNRQTDNQGPRAKNQELEEANVWLGADGPENLNFDSDNLEPETWNLKLQAENSQLATRNSKLPLLVLIAAVVAGLALVAGIGIAQDLQRAGGQFASVGPLRGAWLTFGQWTLGQWPGTLRRLSLLPFGLLALLGAATLVWDLRQGRHLRGAIVLLALGGFPTLLFAVLLSWRDFYEPRYLTIVYPFWLLLLGWAIPEVSGFGPHPLFPLSRASARERGLGGEGQPAGFLNSQFSILNSLLVLGSWFLVLGSFYISTRALFIPERGIFSGAIIKEDFRGAVRELAKHVHPGDLVIVHPDAIVPLYEYYAPRVASWPLPEPTFYSWLGRGENETEAQKQAEDRAFDIQIRGELGSAPRAWLLIAPEHAKVVDPPDPGDRFGLVGLAFEYGDSNGRLMCGTGNAERAYAGFVGVSLYCNNMPSVDGAIPEPEVRRPAVFGDELRLRGYTVEPFAGGLRAGGPLPLTLYWEPLRSLAGTDYIMFVHLTRPDDPTPLVQIDGQPMEGGLPTALWTEPLAQLHDERTLLLRDEDDRPLEAGTYVLRLGVYRRADGSRLAVGDTAAPVLDNAVVLGEVEVLPAAEASVR